MPDPLLRYVATVRAAELALEDAKRAYLKSWGWQHTCNTPGSVWLWVHARVPLIGQVACSTETALHLTCAWNGLEGREFPEDMD